MAVIDVRLYPGQASPNDVALSVNGELAGGSASGDSSATGAAELDLAASSSGNSTATGAASVNMGGSAAGGSSASGATEERDGGVSSGDSSASGAPRLELGGSSSGGSSASGLAHVAIAGVGSGDSSASGATDERMGGVGVGNSDATGDATLEMGGVGSGNSDAYGVTPPPTPPPPPPVNTSVGDGVRLPSAGYWERFHRANEIAIARRLAQLAKDETPPIVPPTSIHMAGRSSGGSDAAGHAFVRIGANPRRIQYASPGHAKESMAHLAAPGGVASGNSEASGDLMVREPIDDLELMTAMMAFAIDADDDDTY